MLNPIERRSRIESRMSFQMLGPTIRSRSYGALSLLNYVGDLEWLKIECYGRGYISMAIIDPQD